MDTAVDVFMNGPVGQGIRLPGSVVVRRGTMSLAQYREAAASGALTLEAPAICDLELGGQVIASGTIVSGDDGEMYFVATKEEIDG